MSEYQHGLIVLDDKEVRIAALENQMVGVVEMLEGLLENQKKLLTAVKEFNHEIRNL